jgi:hypothetical protein
MEKLAVAAPDVDGDGEFIFDGMFDQPAANLPGGVLWLFGLYDGTATLKMTVPSSAASTPPVQRSGR